MKFTADRPSQVAYGQHVRKIFTQGGKAALEGACGLGKSWGFLIPALETAEQYKKVLITSQSLGHLNQLRSDLIKHCPNASWAVLKGHNTYLCVDDHDWSKLHDLDPVWHDTLYKWSKETVTGELDEVANLPELIKKHVSRSSSECREEDCWHTKAKAKALSANVVITTHNLLATYHMYNNMSCDLLGIGRAEDLGPAPYGTVTRLVIDESHLFEDSITLTHEQEVPFYDPLALSRKPFIIPDVSKDPEKQHALEKWYKQLPNDIVEFYFKWKIYKKIQEDIIDRSLSVSLATAVKDTNYTSKRLESQGVPNYITLDKETINLFHVIHEYHRADPAMDRLSIASEILECSSVTAKGTTWGDTALALTKPHEKYIDSVDGKMVLRPSCPQSVVDDILKYFPSVILTSATIVRTPTDVPRTAYESPFDPSRMHIHCRDKKAPSTKHVALTEAWLNNLATEINNKAKNYSHVSILTSSKYRAKQISNLIPNSVCEANYGLDKTRNLNSAGKIGIYHTWFGWDLPGDNKLIVLEKDPTEPPNRSFAALSACRGYDFARDCQQKDHRAKILQGIGRGLRSMTDRCRVVLWDSSIRY